MKLSVSKTKQFPVPGDSDGAYINIRALNMEELAQAESASTELGVGTEAGATMTLNPYARINNVAQKCLTGWGHFFESNGNELKFNKKSLKEMAKFAIAVDDKKIRFLEWVDRCHTELLDEMEAESDNVSKN